MKASSRRAPPKAMKAMKAMKMQPGAKKAMKRPAAAMDDELTMERDGTLSLEEMSRKLTQNDRAKFNAALAKEDTTTNPGAKAASIEMNKIEKLGFCQGKRSQANKIIAAWKMNGFEHAHFHQLIEAQRQTKATERQEGVTWRVLVGKMGSIQAPQSLTSHSSL